jgi:hypothetical protein
VAWKLRRVIVARRGFVAGRASVRAAAASTMAEENFMIIVLKGKFNQREMC